MIQQRETSRNDASETLSGQFQLLRAHVEDEVRKPAVILVTSARRGDGKSLTAFSLARCLAQSGRRTALVDATPGAADDELTLAPSGFNMPAVMKMPNSEAGHSRESLTEFLCSLRAAYEFTIVDSAALLTNNVGMALAATVDGLLIAVRLGRAPTEDDDLTIRMIERSGGHVIGVVATVPDAIEEFERGRSVLSGSDRTVHAGALNGGPVRPALQRVIVGAVALVFVTLGAALLGSSR